MAYQRADPRSFVPPGLQTINIPHHEMMARVVVRRVPRAHEDYGIVSLNPPPLNAPMNFMAVQDVLFEFLKSISMCKLGNASHLTWVRRW
jgi:hypothetical protein